MNEMMQDIPAKATTSLVIHWRHLAMWLVLLGLFGLFVRAVQPILLPFVLGITIAYLMDPLASSLGRIGVKRHVAAALLTLFLFTVIIATLIWLGPLLYDQLVSIVSRLPELSKQLAQSAQQDAGSILKTLHTLAGPEANASIPNSVSEILQRGFASVGNVVNQLLVSALSVINIMALLLITPIVCFYLIRDWPGVLERSDALLPRAYAAIIREQLHLINKTLAAYLRGQITVVLVQIVFYSVAFAVIGVNYSLLLGLLAGLVVIVPYIGSLISVSLGLVIAYGQFGMDENWWAMVVVYTLGNILESQILTPKIIGDRVGLHPLWMLFGMLCGAVLFGFVGVLLAVPLTAVLSVLVKFAIGLYLESSLYRYQ